MQDVVRAKFIAPTSPSEPQLETGVMNGGMQCEARTTSCIMTLIETMKGNIHNGT